MGLIVISKVLKYRAFIIALTLVSTLAFFQTNQTLEDNTENASSGNNQTTEGSQPESPSKPETPDPPETPDLPVDDIDSNPEKTSVRISINTNANNGNNESSVEIKTDPEIPMDDLEENLKDGNVNVSYETDGEGHFEVDFDSDFRHRSKTNTSIDQEIKRDIESD